MTDHREEGRRDYPPVDKLPFTIDHLLAHLQIEADFVVDRAVVTRGQRLVLRDLLQQAHDEIERLQHENEALRIDLTQGATEAFAAVMTLLALRPTAAWTTWKD